jgi:hypothetical protein
MTYSDFLAEFRKSKKYKLEKKISNFQELLEKSKFLKDKNLVLHSN